MCIYRIATMKKLLFLIGVIMIFVACSSQKKTIETKHKTIEVETEDSLEYQLETFDQRFDTWYILHDSPAQYNSQSYYEGWNKQYVSAWNVNANDPRKNSFFETIIGYDPTIDYGFELNHKLFYYFQYVEHVLKIQIMPGGPRAGSF